MKKTIIKKLLTVFVCAVMVIASIPVSAFADESSADVTAMTQAAASATESESELELESEAEEPAQCSAELAAAETITGTFDSIEGYDIATIRYYTDSNMKDYAFAEFTYDAGTGKYTYSFEAPYSGFALKQGTEYVRKESAAGCTIVASYFSTVKWDGAVDVSWYNETDEEFYISTPAQFAGLAAIVNGSVDSMTEPYDVKGTRSDLTGKTNGGLPDYIECKYEENASLVAGVTGEVHRGIEKHDFSDKIIYLTADLDMGGASGEDIDMSKNVMEISNGTTFYKDGYKDIYPNWMPIGGEFLADPDDDTTMVISSFNGTFDGCGHHIDNVYCFRYSYAHPEIDGYTAYGYAQGTGLFGVVGSLYDGESDPANAPSIRNASLSGFLIGRRMVGGFIGCVGGGGNAAAGTTVSNGICFENLANHAYVYGTDSKGLGGIVGCSMAEGGYIINCYNTGYLCNDQYAAPTGGIIGTNEAMNIYCCYNSGTVYTGTNNRGRGIGSDNGGKDYTVSDCYYLAGSTDSKDFPGYYNPEETTAKSVKVTVTELTSSQMTDGTLLAALNVNGIAYVRGDDGYPVLYWEKNGDDTGALSFVQPDGGEISVSREGQIKKGTVVYLYNTPASGYRFRYFKNNNQKLTADYVVVNDDCSITAFFEPVKPGVLAIVPNDDCDITVMKTGIIMTGQTVKNVTNYAIKAGDSLYEGDVIIVKASVREGAVPADKNLTYKDLVNDSQPFAYKYTYNDGEPQVTYQMTYTVTSEIAEDSVVLTLEVVPETTEKLWRHVADTSWYNDTDKTFTLTNARQLAGLAVLVDGGNTFEGKTILLGNDISLANDDGTDGTRCWDGIGTEVNPFAGTFDGNGHTITGMNCTRRALFSYVTGTEGKKAAVKNLTIYGTACGTGASGFVSVSQYADISGCTSYVRITGNSSSVDNSGGIVGYARRGTTISNCINYAKVSACGYVGGIVGQLASGKDADQVMVVSTVTGCINKGDISAADNGGNHIGGITGSTSGVIEKSANYGNIYAEGRTVGGIAGQSVSTASVMTECYNAGTVTLENSTNSNDCIGGLIGLGTYYKITNCFNYGKISSEANSTGGLVGKEGAKSSSSTSNAYFLDSSCSYAEAGTKVEKLPSATYTAGMKSATAAEFAQASGVLQAINGNKSFVLTNGSYPEFASVAVTHVHSGGSATCSTYAVCDVCGLEYGDYDTSIHLHKLVEERSEPVWNIDGSTGDTVCTDCGAVIRQGTIIPADDEKEAVSVKIKAGNGEFDRTYTIAEFDALKTTKAIAYSFGTKSTEIMVASEYVTIASIFEDCGIDSEKVKSITVWYAGNSDLITMDTLNTCCYYYEEGSQYEAPAAIAIKYTSETGTLSALSKLTQTNEVLRFGYGISEEQYSTGASVGGRRLVSPVSSITITLNEGEEYVEKEKEPVAVSGVELSAESAVLATSRVETKEDGEVIKNEDGSFTITQASTFKLKATVSPANADNRAVTWSSSDESVASVDATGLVTAHKFSKNPVTITVRTVDGGYTASCTIQTRYWDVAGNNVKGTEGYQYWFDPVYWAADKGITAGYQQVYFGAELNCTRGALAVFLWRLAGKPDVSNLENPFNDVKESELPSKTYYNAILWAYSKGITKGYSDGGFHPNDRIVRKDIMIMIYRYAGKPDVSGYTKKMTFTDVVGTYKTGTDTYKAIYWAYCNGITNGYSSGEYTGQFGCDLYCLRKDIATFLWRYNKLK